MKRLIFVQHCQSEHHINGLTGGWTDTPLTELGIEQAMNVGRRIRGIIDEDYTIYSSDLLRVQQTAQYIGEFLIKEPILESGLRERNYGIAKDHTSEWLMEHMSSEPIEDILNHRPIEGAETVLEFCARIGETMEKIRKEGNDNVIIVSHGGVLKQIILWWMKIPAEAGVHASFRGYPGGITILGMNNGYRQLDILSDMSHLM